MNETTKIVAILDSILYLMTDIDNVPLLHTCNVQGQ